MSTASHQLAAEQSQPTMLPPPLVHEDAPLEKKRDENSLPDSKQTPSPEAQPSPSPSNAGVEKESNAKPDKEPSSATQNLREVKHDAESPGSDEVDLVSNAKAIQVLDEVLGPRPTEPQDLESKRPERVDTMIAQLRGSQNSSAQANANTRRGVIYHSKKQLPAVLAAAAELQQVQLDRVEREQASDQYRLTYAVDSASKLSRQDILFRSGSTAFSDSDSFFVVQDLANALHDPALDDERFMIEGHASAEGDAVTNLRLSQERAQRIARELVAMGIAPRRVVPIGYGESQARHDADASETKRRLDRRVVIYRLTEKQN